MKFSLLVSAAWVTVSVHGFAPCQSQTRKTSLNVETTPDFLKNSNFGSPERRVAIPPTVKEVEGKRMYRGPVMLDHSFAWPMRLAAMVPVFLVMYPYPLGAAMSAFHFLLAALTGSQANRVRVVMENDSFELFNLANSGEYLKEKPSNYVKGTINRWYYKDITDVSFWPSQQFPFIVFFKETATDRDVDGNFGWWGKFAELHDPTFLEVEGQPHFMPALFDVDQFVDQLAKHGVKPRETYWGTKWIGKGAGKKIE